VGTGKLNLETDRGFPTPSARSIPLRQLTQRPAFTVGLCVNVGPPGIEPGLNAPHALVLPVYYGPNARVEALLPARMERLDSTTMRQKIKPF